MQRTYIIILVGVLLSCMPLFLLNNCLHKSNIIPDKLEKHYFEGLYNLIPVVVIGSGPGGLGAALYSARAKKYVVVLDGNKPGGLLTETTWVENWPGTERILGPDLIEKLRNHAEQFGAHFISDAVDSVDISQWPFVIYTEEGTELRALTLIVATGAVPKRLQVPGEERYWGTGVTTCAVCDAPFYKNKNVVVIGGGDSAIEEALQLSSYAKSVIILARGSRLRASGRMQDLIKDNNNITVQYDRTVREIRGDNTKVTDIVIYNASTNQEETMPIDGVFLAIGHEPNTALFKGKLNTDAQGYILVQGRSQATNIPGIFAAGDVEDSVYRQAGVAVGSGIKAALDADRFLNDHGFTPELVQSLHNQWFTQNNTKDQSVLSTVDDLQSMREMIQTSSIPLVVDFYADYCPSCVQMLPLFEAVARNYEQKAIFITVDVQKARDIVNEYKIEKVPAVLIFKGGQLVNRYENNLNKETLKKALDEAL